MVACKWPLAICAKLDDRPIAHTFWWNFEGHQFNDASRKSIWSWFLRPATLLHSHTERTCLVTCQLFVIPDSLYYFTVPTLELKTVGSRSRRALRSEASIWHAASLRARALTKAHPTPGIDSALLKETTVPNSFLASHPICLHIPLLQTWERRGHVHIELCACFRKIRPQ